MKEFQLGNFIAYEVSDIADTLREIADRIDQGYTSGITAAEGVCWSIDKNEEEQETDENFDHYEVCSDGLWYKFYERDNAVAFACRNEYPIYGVKDGKREPVEI